jgi:hypothetical protein
MDGTEDYTLSAYEALLDGIVAKAWETYKGNDVIELASAFDTELRKEGITMTFAWLWSRAAIALNEW